METRIIKRQPTEFHYHKTLTEAELHDDVLQSNIIGEMFSKGYSIICWLCNPPVGFTTFEIAQEHSHAMHRTWHF